MAQNTMTAKPRKSKTTDSAPLFDAAPIAVANEPRIAAKPSPSARPDAPAEADESPKTAPRDATPRKRETAETMAARQREISVSEFFAKNRHLLGFDNKRKALLTTVKEAVDNSLDACEEAGILPGLFVAIEQLGEDRFRVTVRDNGPGIVKAQIPNVFGKLLYGSKFHRLKMSRGQQGIGISAAGMYGLLTTGRPIHITSRTGKSRPAHHFQIQIDTTKNRPDIVHDDEIEVPWESGTEVAIELAATYAKGKQSVDEYLEQTAIANPHAEITYRLALAGDGVLPEERVFPRGSQDLPAQTREIQPHPHGIELGVLMKMLKDSAPAKRGERSPTLSGFLQESFSRVTSRVANEIIEKAGVSTRTKPAELPSGDVEKLYRAMQAIRIMAPPTDCLAPIGVRALLAGLLKEVKAEFYTATTRDPAVYRGNPFLIEVGMAFGGNLPAEESARVIRFANRVPLLYQQSACASFKSVIDVDWRNYGVSQPGGNVPVGPLVVMIHMASVWVPFTSESKEAIADYDEIRKEMMLALRECGRKLAAYVRRRRRQRLESERRSIFERYIADVAESLANMTGASEKKLLTELQTMARRRTAEADVELDEDGKPISKAAEPEPELSGDESTVIVAENQAATEPAGEELFEPQPGQKQTKRRRRA
ncbi:MAG: DNA topoisomerase VI subunit B [Phycisphaerales bacterium]|nr:DNA topoisomerase VI subunit B [Phycisphaerales bacterium]